MVFNVYGASGLGDAHYDGFVKVKLVHAQQGSLIVPDQLYFRSPQAWFQPNTFLPCQLIKSDDLIECRLHFDLRLIRFGGRFNYAA